MAMGFTKFILFSLTLLMLLGCNPHGEESTFEIVDTGFSVSIARSSGQGATTAALPVSYDVTFSEAINPLTFTSSDITQNGTATGVTWAISHVSGNTNFTLSATATTSEGTLIPSIAKDKVETDNRRQNSASTGGLNTVLFDATPATITSVSSSSANTCYLVGQTIAVNVNFSEAVFVNTGGGTPTVLLETGAIDQAAPYTSGSGTSTLTFTYTVQAGDSSADLDYVATTSLTLNGGTIVDGANSAAILTLPAVAGGNSLGSNNDLELPARDVAALTPTIDSPSEITLNWTNPGGSTQGYRLAFAVGATPPANCGGGTDLAAVLTTQTTNLILNTQYSYRLCAYNTCNNDSTGTTVSATTARLAFSNRTTVDGLPSNNLNDVYLHTNNDVQVSTNGSGWSLSTNGGTSWTNRTTANGLGNDVVHSSYRDSVGNILVSTNSGVSVSTDAGVSFTNRDNTTGLGGGAVPLGEQSLSVQVDSSDNIVASTLNGVSTSGNLGVAFTNRTTGDGLPSNLISYSFVNAANNIYAATLGSGMAISTNLGVSWTVFNVGGGHLPSDTVNVTFANAAGTNIFAGTAAGVAISTNSGTTWTTRDTTDGLPNNNIVHFIVDSNNYFYAATSAGLAVSTDNGVSWDTYRTTDGLGSDNVRGIAIDSSGNLYIATANGLGISTTPVR